MSVWLIRHGKKGKYLKDGFVLNRVIYNTAQEGIADFTNVSTRENLFEEFKKFPFNKGKRLTKYTKELWWFKNDIKVNDFVVVPLKNPNKVAIAKISGEYEYLTDEKYQTRKCEWEIYETKRPNIEPSVWKEFPYYTVIPLKETNVETQILTILEETGVSLNSIQTTPSNSNGVSGFDDQNENEINRIDGEKLNEDGVDNSVTEQVKLKRIKRFQKHVNQLKMLYDNKCQFRDCQFTFVQKNGENYSEGHHVISLSRGGKQHRSNVVILCPNHHRMMHFADVNPDIRNGNKRKIIINGEENIIVYHTRHD